MEIDNLFQPGSTIQVEFSNDDGLKYSFPTCVIRSLKSQPLKLVTLKKDSYIDQLKPGTDVNIICHNEVDKHDYVFATEFLNLKPYNLPIIELARPMKIQYSSRRRHFRCDVNLPFIYFDNHKKEFHGSVTNLSVGGLLAAVSPDYQLTTGKLIEGQIILPNVNKPIQISGHIARIDQAERYNNIGICFSYVTKEQQDHITRYLFRRQQALIDRHNQFIFDQTGTY